MRKKIFHIIPIILASVILFFGFVSINICNTKMYSIGNDEREHLDSTVIEMLGIDFVTFIKDNSEIKISKNDNNKFVVEIGKDSYELNGDILGNLKERVNKEE